MHILKCIITTDNRYIKYLKNQLFTFSINLHYIIIINENKQKFKHL